MSYFALFEKKIRNNLNVLYLIRIWIKCLKNYKNLFLN